jgi:hypothetical protein
MGGVLVSTHSSLALAWTWDAVGYWPPAGVVMTTRDCVAQIGILLIYESAERLIK